MSDLRRRQEEQEEEQQEALQLPAALLEEKNQEIDHLNQQLLRLQQEVELTRDNRVRPRASCWVLHLLNV